MTKACSSCCFMPMWWLKRFSRGTGGSPQGARPEGKASAAWTGSPCVPRRSRKGSCHSSHLLLLQRSPGHAPVAVAAGTVAQQQQLLHQCHTIGAPAAASGPFLVVVLRLMVPAAEAAVDVAAGASSQRSCCHLVALLRCKWWLSRCSDSPLAL